MPKYEDDMRRRHRPAHATRTAQSCRVARPGAVIGAVERRLATAEEMAGFAEAWRAWGGHPGAYLARLSCEAIGFAD